MQVSASGRCSCAPLLCIIFFIRFKQFKRGYPLDVSCLPPPLWRVHESNRRLVGKQSVAPALPTSKPRRVVKSHNRAFANVVWSSRELAELESISHWRDRQRIEERLFHNRTALEPGLHFLLLQAADGVAARRECGMSNKNLSEILSQTCGGAVDRGRAPSYAKRDSVQSQKRISLVIRSTMPNVVTDTFCQYHMILTTCPLVPVVGLSMLVDGAAWVI